MYTAGQACWPGILHITRHLLFKKAIFIFIRGYRRLYYHQLLLGLSAVLRSRRTYTQASQDHFSTAALRGTCFYPPALQPLNLYGAFTTQSQATATPANEYLYS